MKSFFNFDIEWPDILANFLHGVARLTTFVTFDFVQLPGLGCLTKMPYDTKILVMTILPFLIGLAMWTPVLVLWCRFRWSKSRSEKPSTDDLLFDPVRSRKESKAQIILEDRLKKTTTHFWNNILTWLFLVYPGTTLASLQVKTP